MTAIDKPQRRWSLRTLLSLNLVAFALVPALLVMFWMYRNNLDNIHGLSDKLIEDAATHLLDQTEGHIEQVHRVLDGILLRQPGTEQAQTAQALLGKPLDFEMLAFTITRLTREVVFVQMALPGGDFISVRRGPPDRANEVVVHQRLPQADDDQFFDARAPDDRSRPPAAAGPGL